MKYFSSADAAKIAVITRLLQTGYPCSTVNPFTSQISHMWRRSLSPIVEFREIMRKSRDSINHRVPEARSVSCHCRVHCRSRAI